MGLLTVGLPLSYEETKAISSYVREHGVSQFLFTWNRVRNIENDELRFGDEVEVGVFAVDSASKTVKLSLRATEIRELLKQKEQLVSHQAEGVTWHPEFGSWMVESTPSRPYSNYASDLLRVERNMILRRRRLLSVLKENEIAPTVTCFMLLGVGDFIDNPLPFEAPHSHSEFIPDYAINPHPRFAALTRNIRTRRGSKVDIRVPLFRDKRTPEFLSADSPHGAPDLPPNYRLEPDTDIHMDCMAFGMGMCCLQVTFQGKNVDESRYMYDQLAVLAPIMLALTAGTPIFKGRLSGVDARWTVISQSCDDRTAAERGSAGGSDPDAQMAGEGVRAVPKSRYDSVSTYIYHCKGQADCQRTFEVYNDVPCPVDAEVKQRLRAAGIDENLAHHMGHLYVRDPLVVYEGLVEIDDEASTDHFENIQSTNWQTCRWKPPPPRISSLDPHIGWRTEFRSMEVQLTDYENAAFTVFVVLVTRVLLAFDLALYIPLSKVDENMQRAHRPSAYIKEKFFFRKFVAPPEVAGEGAGSNDKTSGGIVSSTSFSSLSNMAQIDSSAASPQGRSPSVSEAPRVQQDPPCAPAQGATRSKSDPPPPAPLLQKSPSLTSSPACYICGDGSAAALPHEDSYEEMTADEIFNGKGGYYPGLIPLVYAYLDFINCDSETFLRVDGYLKFISKRARGELLTPAAWMRKFVAAHPAYKQDSVVSPVIAHDLLMACQAIGNGTLACPEVLGSSVVIDRVRAEDAYGALLAGALDPAERSELLNRLMQRALQQRDPELPRGKSPRAPRGAIVKFLEKFKFF